LTLNGEQTVATATSNEVDEIRRRMAQIRKELHQDMQNVVAGAEAATDWRHYVRLYPWACLALAFGAGFMVVPRKRRSVSRTAEKAAEAAVAKVSQAVGERVPVETPRQVDKEKKRSGLLGATFGMLMPVAMRAAQSYAASFVENWIAQQAMGGPLPTAPGAGPGRTPPTTPGPGRTEARRPY
jgi:hypothetical protein